MNLRESGPLQEGFREKALEVGVGVCSEHDVMGGRFRKFLEKKKGVLANRGSGGVRKGFLKKSPDIL